MPTYSMLIKPCNSIGTVDFSKCSKCDFGASKIEYLGHIVRQDGMRKDPKMISKMQEWTCPKTLKSLCGVLGLIFHYKTFVKTMVKLQPI